MLFLLDFFIFLLVLISVILTPLVSLPFFPKILSDQTLFSQFIFSFGIFLAFLFYLIRSILKSYVLSLKSYVMPIFAVFSIVVLIETLISLKPAFSFTTKQFAFVNVDSLLPGLAWLSLFLFFLIFISHPFIQKFKKILFPLLLAISFLSILSNLGYLKETPRLSLSASWKIAVSQIGASPLVGTGPGQFTRAFDKFKPVELNNSPFWQFKFNNSANEYLDLLTTTGLLGFGAYIVFLFLVLKEILYIVRARLASENSGLDFSRSLSRAKSRDAKNNLMLLLTVICLLLPIFLAFFLPFSLPLRMAFVMLVGLFLNKIGDRSLSRPIFEESIPLSGILTPQKIVASKRLAEFFGIIIVLTTLFLLIPYFRAELSYKESLDALNQNQSQSAYQKNLEAIQFFPYKDSYHLTLSQISLAWANALAQSANRQITTEQKTLVGQLLGQAINQAKLAVTLAPNKASNWENLGLIYKNLIGVAADSDRWSLAAFNSASQLSPFNPALQLEIGGVYFIDKNYLQAEKYFLNSLFLKPDYANGFYNLALAQHAQGKMSQAKDSLKQTISLTTPGSTDFQNAQKQLILWNQEEATKSGQ